MKKFQALGTQANIENADKFALRFERIFDLMEGDSHSSLAQELNNLGSRTRLGKEWKPQSVSNLRKRLEQIKINREKTKNNCGFLTEYVLGLLDGADLNSASFGWA